MEAIKASGSENVADRMVEIEMEAAEALAGLAHGDESVSERVKVESDAGNYSCFAPLDSCPNCSIDHCEQDQACFGQKNIEKKCIWTAKKVKDEQRTELGSNASYPTKYASLSGRKSRHSLTEAEKEARRIRRVQANRESARQTIRRRQAMYEELLRKATDLACENKNLKRKKETASEAYKSLKSTNECLKAQMINIVKVEEDEVHGESRTSYEELHTCSSSTNSPLIMCSQSSFFPFAWPSFIPISSTHSSSSEKAITRTNPLYLLPYPWIIGFPQNINEHQDHSHSFNLNDPPIESSIGNLHSASSSSKPSIPPESQLFVPETSCSIESIHADSLNVTQICPLTIESNPTSRALVPWLETCVKPVPEEATNNRQKPCDMAAAAEARKRRKELKKEKEKELHGDNFRRIK